MKIGNFLLVTGAVLGAVACGSDDGTVNAPQRTSIADLAHTLCEQALGCGCESDIDLGTCVENLIADAEEELITSDECVAALGSMYEGVGCGGMTKLVSLLPTEDTGCNPPPKESGTLDDDCERECSVGFNCDFNTKKCVVAAPEGGACESDMGCDRRTRCVSGTCVRNSLGDPCTTICTDGSACLEGTCVARREIGETCGLGDCVLGTGYCDVKQGVCVAVGEASASCQASHWCASYRCVDGRCDGDTEDPVVCGMLSAGSSEEP